MCNRPGGCVACLARWRGSVLTAVTFAFQDLSDIDELQGEDSDGEEDDGHDEL